MEPTTTALSIDDLLPLEDFVRSLARRLVRDAAEADDVVQDALLVAWKSPPRDKAALPAWLGTVVRRIASRRRQMDTAREHRESRAARAESLSPSPEDVLLREEKRRLVIEQLLALPESHREVLLLHYYEGLSPKEIATRLSRPAGTVRSQLKRGLDELRERLDRAHDGDRRSWALSLIPLTLPGLGRPALVVSGGLIMGVLAMKKTMLAMAALLALGSWGVLESWFEGGGTMIEVEPDRAPKSSLASSDEGAEAPANASVDGPDRRRQEITTDETETPLAGLRLQLLEATGQPAAELAYGTITNEFPAAPEGWAHEVVAHIDNHLLPTASLSTADGSLTLASRTQELLLWVRRRAGWIEFFELQRLPEDRIMRLSPTRKFRVVCPGLQTGERWHMYLLPALRDNEDGDWSLGGCIYRRLADRVGMPRYVAMEVRKTEQKGGRPVEVIVPEGQPFNVDIVVGRHVVTYQGQEYDVKVAPAMWRFVPGPLLPTVDVTFVDGKGKALPPQSGIWAVKRARGYIDHERFADANPLSFPFQTFKDNAKYRIQIITEEGDYKNWDIEFDKKRSDRHLKLVRSRRPDGLRLDLPPSMAKTNRLTLIVEGKKGQTREAVDLFLTPWLRNRPLPAFIPRGKDMLFLEDKAQGFERLWLHTAEGRVAVYDPATEGEPRFQALPMGAKGEIDLHAVYQKVLATGPTIFELRFEPRPGVVLRINRVQTRETGTRWALMPYHLPKGIKATLHVRIMKSSRVPVEFPLPLSKKN